MKFNQWFTLIAIILFFSVAGCAGPVSTAMQDIPTGAVMATPSVTARAVTPTAPPTTSPRTPTWTVAPADRLTPQTPRPSLAAGEAKALIFDLLENNGGCQLPCLWGITPGKTGIPSLNDFIAQFGNVTSPNVYIRADDFGELGGFSLSYRENNVHIGIGFSYYKNGENTRLDILTMNGSALYELGKDPDWLSPEVSPLYGDASFNQAFEYYLLPQILSNYGQPNQVLLAAFPDDPDRSDITWHPFSLVLLYPEEGIFVEYVSPQETAGDNFVGCPSKSHLSLAVWSPESGLPLKYVIQKAGSEINELNVNFFRPVEEATSLTLNDFYHKFKEPENMDCLETPMKLWASP
jgi:hypothetical protein